jgi:hypothetical protein
MNRLQQNNIKKNKEVTEMYPESQKKGNLFLKSIKH